MEETPLADYFRYILRLERQKHEDISSFSSSGVKLYGGKETLSLLFKEEGFTCPDKIEGLSYCGLPIVVEDINGLYIK